MLDFDPNEVERFFSENGPGIIATLDVLAGQPFPSDLSARPTRTSFPYIATFLQNLGLVQESTDADNQPQYSLTENFPRFYNAFKETLLYAALKKGELPPLLDPQRALADLIYNVRGVKNIAASLAEEARLTQKAYDESVPVPQEIADAMDKATVQFAQDGRRKWG